MKVISMVLLTASITDWRVIISRVSAGRLSRLRLVERPGHLSPGQLCPIAIAQGVLLDAVIAISFSNEGGMEGIMKREKEIERVDEFGISRNKIIINSTQKVSSIVLNSRNMMSMMNMMSIARTSFI